MGTSSSRYTVSSTTLVTRVSLIWKSPGSEESLRKAIQAFFERVPDAAWFGVRSGWVVMKCDPESVSDMVAVAQEHGLGRPAVLEYRTEQVRVH